ncbi:MAG TPA: hypothetical protein PL193_14595 [Xanthobacteraceae bacterium]|nr:hypothetical protein [Xanthobacteraceae bacterium]
MLMGILHNTPYWVWGVFVLLLVLGLMQTRKRTVSRFLVFLLPLIMIPLSFSTVASVFGMTPLPLIAWLAGIAAAFASNMLVFQAPAGVRYDERLGKFEIPGSAVPLLLMMTIFLARFVIGFTRAVNPALVATSLFAGVVAAILGFCSGLFAARALKIISAQRAA